MKHVHLYYDIEEDSLVLAGTDNRPLGYYSIEDPLTPIRALMSETLVDKEWRDEEKLLRKKD